MSLQGWYAISYCIEQDYYSFDLISLFMNRRKNDAPDNIKKSGPIVMMTRKVFSCSIKNSGTFSEFGGGIMCIVRFSQALIIAVLRDGIKFRIFIKGYNMGR